MREHAENLRSTLVLKRAKWCPGRDLNPHFPCEKKDFKSFASADFATRALFHTTTATTPNLPSANS